MMSLAGVVEVYSVYRCGGCTVMRMGCHRCGSGCIGEFLCGKGLQGVCSCG